VIFFGLCDELMVMMTVPEFGLLNEAQGNFILGDIWSQQKSRPRTIGNKS